MAICNNNDIDDQSKAVDVKGTLKGAGPDGVDIDYILPFEGFTCFLTPVKPPDNPPRPDPRIDGVGKACEWAGSDLCGTDMAHPDKNQCCGIAQGGKVLKLDGIETTD